MENPRPARDRSGMYLGKFWGKSLGVAGFLGIALYLTPAIAQSITLSANFKNDPVRLTGSAGGPVSIVSLAGIEGKCRGFANSQPNHVITLSDNFMLDMLVYSNNINEDLTMLVKGPNGMMLCADDEYQGRTPQVARRRMTKGTYQIWIGTGDANKSANYTLSLSEYPQK